MNFHDFAALCRAGEQVAGGSDVLAVLRASVLSGSASN